MGINCLIFLQLLFTPVSTHSVTEYHEHPALMDYLSEHDSVDFWTTQWDACYDATSNEFSGAITIYGAGIILTKDSLYQFGFYHGVLKVSANNLVPPKASFVGDSLYIFGEKSSECPIDGENCKHKVIRCYLRKSVPSAMVKTLLLEGTTCLNKNSFFGIELSQWVTMDIPEKYDFLKRTTKSQ